ncbi:MAG: family N-acetyltransferase [Gemmatimonadetes bacterium]|nr:family N-acetyltransferase [Gemmatimonadota bacterium]
MRARLNNGQWYCWVGERGGIIVGNVWASLIEKMPNPLVEPEEHVYITNFFVTDEARGAGNGTRILAAALAWCAERGIHGAILWPTARGRPLYERLGFSAKGEVMQKLFAPIQH